jgi:Tfp pilus assembly protein PilO
VKIPQKQLEAAVKSALAAQAPPATKLEAVKRDLTAVEKAIEALKASLAAFTEDLQ